MDNVTRFVTVGRRKESIARVVMTPGQGTVTVNGVDMEKYFVRETDRIMVHQPMRLTNTATKYDVVANLSGGGITGQAGALRHAVARALLAAEPELKDMLRKNDFLTRDPRMKERKKSGLKGARKRFQWTKR
ncbi:MAG: 30S ribosomal protein S9 [Candidatus Omnitrophica bacterium]|nr:30S ribosomal protein S9 [Candidatus Omnitrophota bacterium]MDD4940818.1 30S ribosomal protein S9 [Candidatus Omnitrophota bacterium]MDD5775622.1 30S ribosomal protein S9 [Candidatus Omnitrophota bacterium]HNQ51273.1 30S ribosomal protein S9 [Candidatus Omnitrophota bacterium]